MVTPQLFLCPWPIFLFGLPFQKPALTNINCKVFQKYLNIVVIRCDRVYFPTKINLKDNLRCYCVVGITIVIL
jgi:hypothetical protein